MKLHTISIGFALGITWAAGTFLLGIFSFIFGWASPLVKVIGSLYIGYEASILGSIIGAVWAFIDAFIFGIVFAWLYNYCAAQCHKKEQQPHHNNY